MFLTYIKEEIDYYIWVAFESRLSHEATES